ncbi:ATP-binding protein [Achromobacter xylosoxidans]
MSILTAIFSSLTPFTRKADSPIAVSSADPSILELTEEERRWIADHPTVLVGVMPNRRPLEYMDDGGLRGLPAEYLKEVSLRTGLTFSFKPTEGTQSRLDWLKNGKIDMLSMASRNLGPVAQDHELLFTSAYIVSAAVVVSSARERVITEVEELARKTVVVPAEGPFAAIMKGKVAELKLTSDTNATSVLDMVAAGQADATVGTELYLLPYLNRRYVGTLQISGVLSSMTAEISMAVHRDNRILWSILQKALRSISARTASELRNAWIDNITLGAPSLRTLLRHYSIPVLICLIAFVLFTFLIYRVWREYRRAVDSERETEIFASIINREIRSPMNTFLASMELLGRTLKDDDQLRLTDLAASGANAVLHLLDGALDISKVDAGSFLLQREPTDITTLARQVVNLQQLRADEKGISLQLSTSAFHHRLLIDGTRVGQILHNLISNAIKFTDKGSVKVEVLFTPSEAVDARGQLRLYVSDTGIGISEQAQAQLFKPYAQAAEAPNCRPGGTGLGLLICRKLAASMKGTLQLHSAPGEGTTVTVTLPVEVYRSNQPSITAVTRGIVQPGVRVLVIGEASADLDLLKMQLEQLGCSVTVETNIAKVQGTFHRARPDIVLIDYNDLHVDQFQVFQEIRRCEGGHGLRMTPVIAVMASSDAGHPQLSAEMGVSGMMRKPIHLAKLRDAIETWCGVRLAEPTIAL